MSALRFGVIGVGQFGRHYVRLLPALPGVELAAVCGRTRESARALTDLPPTVRQCAGPAELLNIADLSAVVIATPASTHLAVACQALAAGKHVLVEKPMALSRAEAIRLQSAVSASRQVFMVAHQYLYNDYLRALRACLQAGRLGTVRFVWAQHCYVGAGRDDVGVFWDAATHELALMDYLLRPQRITHASGVRANLTDAPHEETASSTVIFDDRIALSMVLACRAPIKTRRFVIVGTEGSAVFDEWSGGPPLQLYPASSAAGSVQPEVPSVSAREPLRNELEHFVDCIRTGKTPLTDIAHGLRVTEWLEHISARLVSTQPSSSTSRTINPNQPDPHKDRHNRSAGISA